MSPSSASDECQSAYVCVCLWTSATLECVEPCTHFVCTTCRSISGRRRRSRQPRLALTKCPALSRPRMHCARLSRPTERRSNLAHPEHERSNERVRKQRRMHAQRLASRNPASGLCSPQDFTLQRTPQHRRVNGRAMRTINNRMLMGVFETCKSDLIACDV